ncbi:hypothetical protein FGIG_12558 [Fasciola gigantica]|uniref:Saposin B type region 2 domain-containing protein n=1 Tax=Fasciola gigantica TaxID=46835 RepID=A0A504YE49_FASGI|nr:hypothetical protein FGIG_12558 [Fasciola gigantica]
MGPVRTEVEKLMSGFCVTLGPLKWVCEKVVVQGVEIVYNFIEKQSTKDVCTKLKLC